MKPFRRIGSAIVVVVSMLGSLTTSAAPGEVGYEYDDAGRLKRTIAPDSSQRTYTLDAAGNRTNVGFVVGGGRLQFAAGTASVSEGTPTFSIGVTRTNSTIGAVSVNYSTASGTATSAADFTASSGTLNWSAGDSAAKTISVPIANDSVLEVGETFTILLSNAAGGAVVGWGNEVVVTIQDNDTVTFAVTSTSVGEAAGSATLTVTKSGATTLSHSVTYGTANISAAAGSDYSSTSGVLTFTAAETSKTFPVTLLDDFVYEGNETFSATLSAPTNGASVNGSSNGTITIVDNESPPPPVPGTLRIVNTDFNIAENGGSYTYVISRTGTQGLFGPASLQCYTWDFSANSGSDYVATTQTMTWAAGDASNKTCTIQIINDSVHEQTELVLVYFENASGAAVDIITPHGITIHDEDPVPPQAPATPTWTSTFQPCTGQWGCELMYDVPITWNPVSGATYYELEKAPFGAIYTLVHSGAATNYHELWMNRTIQDWYRLRACNSAGCSGYAPIMILTMPFP